VDLLSNSAGQVCAGLTSLLLGGKNSVDVIGNDALFCDALFFVLISDKNGFHSTFLIEKTESILLFVIPNPKIPSN
jgi:hypothetical protein